MPKPRGATGTVRGMSNRDAERHMLAAVGHIAHRPFTRAGLRDWFMGEHGLTRGKAEGLVFAMTRVPGLVVRVEKGIFVLCSNAAELVRHRDWRFNVPRLTLGDARVLVAALEEYDATGGDLTPLLQDVVRLGRNAITHLERSKRGKQR